MSQASAIAAGKAHTLALAPAGDLAAWGLDASGQRGDGMAANDGLTPIALEPFADALVVAASGNLSLALDGDAGLWGWGQNFSGQLGLGDTTDRLEATAVAGLPALRGIAAGLAHTLVIDEDGELWAWGLNSFGQLGKGDKGNDTNSAAPLKVVVP
ncbi:MAG: hypothetical protein R3B09_22390 [Nannocystaceae bacterium]